MVKQQQQQQTILDVLLVPRRSWRKLQVEKSFGLNFSYLDVGRVEIAEGSQGCRKTIGAAAYPQGLQHA